MFTLLWLLFFNENPPGAYLPVAEGHVLPLATVHLAVQ